MVKAELSTLCYIEKDDSYLMLHRTKKEHDINKGKWIGVGGHFEQDESPDECVRREVLEETGLTLSSLSLRGIVTFISGSGINEYMFLYTASGFSGDLTDCSEGDLEWVKRSKIKDLTLWEGDKIFLKLLADDAPFFSLKLVYDGGDNLVRAVLDGEELLIS